MPASWKQPDFSTDDSPTLNVRYARGALRVGFLVTVTTFLAPKHLSLDELRIESCFPLDDETRDVCARFSREAT